MIMRNKQIMAFVFELQVYVCNVKVMQRSSRLEPILAFAKNYWRIARKDDADPAQIWYGTDPNVYQINGIDRS